MLEYWHVRQTCVDGAWLRWFKVDTYFQLNQCICSIHRVVHVRGPNWYALPTANVRLSLIEIMQIFLWRNFYGLLVIDDGLWRWYFSAEHMQERLTRRKNLQKLCGTTKSGLIKRFFVNFWFNLNVKRSQQKSFEGVILAKENASKLSNQVIR